MQDHGFQRKTVYVKQSLGARCKAARKKKNLTVATAEQEIKIRSYFLEAIEKDNWHLLPESHWKGFVRRYASYLGLPSSLVDDELRQIVWGTQTNRPFSPIAMDERHGWSVTPRGVIVTLIVLVLIAFIGYVGYQVRQFAAPPALAIIQPNGQSVVNSDSFTIEGKTDPGATVTVDGLSATVGNDGSFAYQVTLRPGLNQIVVEAQNRIKKQSSQVVSILCTLPQPTPTPVPTPSPSPTPSPTPSLKTTTRAIATSHPTATVTLTPTPTPTPTIAPTIVPTPTPTP